MSECIIAYRVNGGKVSTVLDKRGEETETFQDLDAAVKFALNCRLFQSGQAIYQIIELDEL
ncbi:MAG: hypothetical protein KGL39_57990 [Patescibacteria group bacterium]|nr:hypothetical protein [Patescibacteria group bacterium]